VSTAAIIPAAILARMFPPTVTLRTDGFPLASSLVGRG
jgi:hypothetical protein